MGCWASPQHIGPRTLWGGRQGQYSCPQTTDEKTEVQRGEMFYPKSRSRKQICTKNSKSKCPSAALLTAGRCPSQDTGSRSIPTISYL